MRKVLVVEDDLLIADMLEYKLINDGFDVCGIATNVAEGLLLATIHNPDLAVVDVRLADGDLGTTLAVELKQFNPQIGILYATGNIDSVKAGATGEACLKKPYSLASITPALNVVEQLMRNEIIGQISPDLIILRRQS